MDRANANTVIDILYNIKCGGCEYSTFDSNGLECPGDEYCGCSCANDIVDYDDLLKSKCKTFWEYLGWTNYCMNCKYAKCHEKPFYYFKCEKNGKIFNTQLEKNDSNIYCREWKYDGAYCDILKKHINKIVKRQGCFYYPVVKK